MHSFSIIIDQNNYNKNRKRYQTKKIDQTIKPGLNCNYFLRLGLARAPIPISTIPDADTNIDASPVFGNLDCKRSTTTH